MTSAYLASDSDSELLSDGSDTELPVCGSVRSPAKLHRPAEGDFSGARNPSGTTVQNHATIKQEKPSLSFGAGGHQPSTPTKTPSQPPKPLTPRTPTTSSLSQPSSSYQSPSPNKLMERHGKALEHQHRLTRKVERLTADIKAKNERASKLEEYRSAGGIRGLARASLHSGSSDGDTEEGSVSADTPHTSTDPSFNESNKFPFPLWAPGYAVFHHTPRLITELYPPGYLEPGEEQPLRNLELNMLQQEDPEVLSQLIIQRWFIMCYRLRPCPEHIWQWLFQITCLSCDEYLAERALMNLKSLVEWAGDKRQVFVPSLTAVLDVLVCLGADQEVLLGTCVAQPRLSCAAEQSDDVFQFSPPFPCGNLSNLFDYLSRALRAHPSSLSADEVCRLVPILITVALDSNLTKQPRLMGSISQCLSSLLAVVPSEARSTVTVPLASQIVQRASHHHDLLHLTRLLPPTTPTMVRLQKAVSKLSIWKIVFAESANTSLTDWEFCWKVVEHFYEKPSSQFVYYQLYSVMCLVGQLLHLSPPEWPTGEKKRAFKSMLSKLASVKIIDKADNPERGPVKDLLISLSLEMGTHRAKDVKQTDLFSYMEH